MFKKIKEYLKCRKYIKTAKKEIAKIASSALPVVCASIEKKAETIKVFHNLVDGAKNLTGEKLVEMVLNIAAEKLAADQTRLMEILQYTASLTPEDMQKIIIHSITASAGKKDSNPLP